MVTLDEVEAVQCVVELVVHHGGKPLNNVGRVADVEKEDELGTSTDNASSEMFPRNEVISFTP